MTASTMSTSRSSSGADFTSPEVPTDDDGGGEPPPTIDVKSMPVAQLSTSRSSSPPTPRPPAPMAIPPERPRMSSILLRSPDVHLIGRPLQGERLQVQRQH